MTRPGPRVTPPLPGARPGSGRPLPAGPSLTALLTACLAVLLMTVGTAPSAAAGTTPADVAAVLRAELLYVAPDAEAGVDEGRVRAALQDARIPVHVALLPDRAADALGGDAALNTAVGRGLGGGAALITVAGDVASGGSQDVGLGAGQADALVQSALRGRDLGDREELTEGLLDAVARLEAAALQGRGAGGAPGGVGGARDGGGSGGVLVLVVLGLLGAGATGLYLLSSRRRRQARLQGYRADVTSLYDRLGSDVSTLAPGDDPVARQALVDAAERYNATGALLATADEHGEYAAARRTVAEGIAAARLARERLGLDPGPEVPPPPSEQPQLIRQEAVQVEGRELIGAPRYAPGRPHYWGGGTVRGRQVPGGWYGVDLGSVVLGGLLGGALSGGLGGSRSPGTGDAFGGSSGGGWSGGGDWGGGGGDWGGGGGGGSW